MASMHDETKKAGIPAISQQQFADDNRGHQTSSGPFSKKTKQALENQRKEAILSLSPSTSNVNKAVRYGLNLVFPSHDRVVFHIINYNSLIFRRSKIHYILFSLIHQQIYNQQLFYHTDILHFLKYIFLLL